MHSLVQDVRYAARQLLRSPGFALTAIISLALGIGAATAVFSVIYAALINPYPYRAPDRLVRLAFHNKTGRGLIGLNGPQIREVRKLSSIASLLAMDYHAMTMTGRDLPTNVAVIGLIASGFADLGMPPLLGRGIAPADAIDGQEPQPVVLLAYKFWQKQLLADPAVVGKTLELDHKKYTIIGVAAPRFTWFNADAYLPLKLTGDPAANDAIILRLQPGVSFATANAQLQPLVDQFARESPKRFPEQLRVHVEGLNEWVERDIGGTLYLLFAAVALLLAIACGNLSILLLARGTARHHELAIRVAIGARRRRIVRQLLTEALLLASLGVLLGVGMAYGMVTLIRLLLPRYAFAPEVVVHIDLPVLLFSAAVAMATGILFGIWPALQLSRARAGQVVQSGSRRVAGSVHGRRSHNALVAFQIALTLLLLTGAAASLQGFFRLLDTPLGYDPHNVLSLEIPLHDNAFTTWAARGTYFEQLRAKAAETPGVLMTAISTNGTPPQNGWSYKLEILGKPAREEQRARFNLVGPEYFALLRVPILRGRIWTATENADAAHVAIINRTMADRYFPAGDAIRHSLKMANLDYGTEGWISAPGATGAGLQIIGIAADARNDGLDKPVEPAVFLPYTLMMPKYTQVLVRAAVPPRTLVRTLRAQLVAVNPDQQIYDYAEDLETWLADEPEWQQAHLTAWVFGIFAGLALVLAGVGMFSVVSYTVAQRANEFGIRMALGAQPADVVRIAFASTTVSVGAGLGAGLVLTVGLSRLVGQWVKGGSRDPWLLLAGVVVLGAVSAIACAVPAWRASRADPMTALRCG